MSSCRPRRRSSCELGHRLQGEEYLHSLGTLAGTTSWSGPWLLTPSTSTGGSGVRMVLRAALLGAMAALPASLGVARRESHFRPKACGQMAGGRPRRPAPVASIFAFYLPVWRAYGRGRCIHGTHESAFAGLLTERIRVPEMEESRKQGR